MKLTKKSVLKKLDSVLDPELSISIVDMGLIYDVAFAKKNKITITMTLTSPGCPLYGIIETDIKDRIKELGIEEKNIKINLVFEPIWSTDKMTKKGKKLLGI